MRTAYTLAARYRALFSIEEIERSTVLQWMFGAILLFFFESFGRFIGEHSATVETAARGTAVCWPYFQSCAHLFTLSAIPFGYTQSELYMIFYGLMLFIVYLMWKNAWTHAHVLMAILWLWKMYLVFVLSGSIGGVYDYYHLILTAVLLFVPFKEYFLKLTFVFLYFMSVTTKFDETWTLGTYFTAMKTGLPIFPTALTPLFTNLVIFSQVIGCWFLLSSKQLYQRLALAFFTIFHLYSGILVFYQYPTIALPPLLILFGPMYRYTKTPFSKRALAGWLLIALIALFQLVGFVISPDRRITLEGNRFGMFMFEANHQCIATIEEFDTGVKVASSTTPTLSCSGFYCLTEAKTSMQGQDAVYESRYESTTAWNRCDPHEWWSQLHTQCTGNVERIAFQFDHSVDGGPFYRIVDVPNICDLSYEPFVHNTWILLPPAAKVVGYPVENFY